MTDNDEIQPDDDIIISKALLQDQPLWLPLDIFQLI